MQIKHSISRVFGLLVFVYTPNTLAAHPAMLGDNDFRWTTETLCLENESIYFSCQLENDKFVSVCGHNNTAPNNGYVKYRYGSKNKIELEYPKQALPPKDRFYWVDVSEGSVDGKLIFFKNNDYRYSVIREQISAAVTVEKGSHVVLRKRCSRRSKLKDGNKSQRISTYLPADIGIRMQEVSYFDY